MQIGDHGDPVFLTAKADEGHLGAWHVLGRCLQVFIEVLVVPDWLLGAKLDTRGRVGIARVRGGFGADNPVKVRTRAVGAARIKAVARGALAGDGLSGLDVGDRQNRSPIGWHFRRRRISGGDFLGHFDGVAHLLGRFDGEQDGRNLPNRQNSQTGREHAARDFVEGQIAHVRLASPLNYPAEYDDSRARPRPTVAPASLTRYRRWCNRTVCFASARRAHTPELDCPEP